MILPKRVHKHYKLTIVPTTTMFHHSENDPDCMFNLVRIEDMNTI